MIHPLSSVHHHRHLFYDNFNVLTKWGIMLPCLNNFLVCKGIDSMFQIVDGLGFP